MSEEYYPERHRILTDEELIKHLSETSKAERVRRAIIAAQPVNSSEPRQDASSNIEIRQIGEANG
jgi:hypothetical protein